ncbi:MAG: DinB family protein [Ktedonobacteraceae bacterium]|nr:DinB family protein [Ktedonobacteraceae bacterium]MBV9616999.1 DinB family protein [Ktedonobacteraceae bacterium]
MPIATSEQIERYEMAPSQVIAALEGLDETHIHYIPAEGEWSIHEIVIHLADSEVMGYWRLRKTLAEEGSILPVYDEATWAQKLTYHAQERELAIVLFTSLRASTGALLRSLPAEAWELTSMHPERGKINVYDLFNVYLQHGEIHLQQIKRIKQFFSTIA